jgi:hypothetical protein
MFDIRNLTPKRKAYLRSLLEPDGDNGGTQFNEEDMGSPFHNSSRRRQRRSHASRKRNLNATSLTASPTSPPQSGTSSRVAKKSKEADSAPPSFKIVSPAPVTAKIVTDFINVHSNSDSDSSSTMSQGQTDCSTQCQRESAHSSES